MSPPIPHPPGPSEPSPRRASRASRTWLLLCTVLGLCSLGFGLLRAVGLLYWRADGWTAKPWTLWSASLVHLTMPHLLANLAALTVLAVLGLALSVNRWGVFAVLVAWPLGTLGLRLWPDEVAAYAGMSGLLMAMTAVLWAHASVRETQKPVGYVLFAALVLKVLSEKAWVHPVAFDPTWGFNVVLAAHLTGAVAGAMAGMAAQFASVWGAGRPE